MGLLDSLFGGYTSPIGSTEKKLLSDEEKLAKEEQERADALALKQKEERTALKQRGQAMQGGGRTGLMFKGSQQGVV